MYIIVPVGIGWSFWYRGQKRAHRDSIFLNWSGKLENNHCSGWSCCLCVVNIRQLSALLFIVVLFEAELHDKGLLITNNCEKSLLLVHFQSLQMRTIQIITTDVANYLDVWNQHQVPVFSKTVTAVVDMGTHVVINVLTLRAHLLKTFEGNYRN